MCEFCGVFVRFCFFFFFFCFAGVCGGRGLRFGMPPLGTRRRFLCRVFSFEELMSLALIADC